MKFSAKVSRFSTFLSISTALGLLGIFVIFNRIHHLDSLKVHEDQELVNEREQIPDEYGIKPGSLAFHDFESGNAADTALHKANYGHGGKQSLRLSRNVPFSPGLWVRFKDLNPGENAWIRATGYVWFSCPPAEAKCSMVATCNHNGINYKYRTIPIDLEPVNPGQWNRIRIDYHIPTPPDREDVLQAYFWYRGEGEVLVDDIDIELYKFEDKQENH